MSDLAENLRALRTARGLSQQRLAELAGISQTTIDKIERGQSKRTRFLIAIANALGVPASALDGGTHSLRIAQMEIDGLQSVGALSQSGNETNEHHVPLLICESLPNTGWVQIGRTPFDHIKPPPFLAGVPNAFAILVADLLMAPEFSPGDVVFLDPRLPCPPGTSALFAHLGNPDIGLLRYIIEDSAEGWDVVSRWTDDEEHLSRAEWSKPARAVATYYRR